MPLKSLAELKYKPNNVRKIALEWQAAQFKSAAAA